ncbi:cytochrome c [Flavitalea sp. BT771]|uniref:c-type cytochrome n=1 Tax=Flavitalea sp. BT771 TaxID=3063329 RepID=UPI0026E2CED5|nr:cytochrome c [Flavitalea sp. BT771]MDO6430572.1 cytochrome c [Flavitalea sp. BT771]MDV6219288.1 cytochrome c [Flavitalea sp. BT771]
MKKLLVLITLSGLIYACSDSGSEKKDSSTGEKESKNAAAASSYDSTKGAGKFTHVDLASSLDHKMADGGKAVYDVKCSSCHKLTGEKLVGPGWKGVTERRKPEWIMNFVTNTEEMLNKDPKAQAMLEICMVKMPNQNLTDTDARNVLEFMRQNDGVK